MKRNGRRINGGWKSGKMHHTKNCPCRSKQNWKHLVDHFRSLHPDRGQLVAEDDILQAVCELMSRSVLDEMCDEWDEDERQIALAEEDSWLIRSELTCGDCALNGRCGAQQRYPYDSGPNEPYCDGFEAKNNE